MDEITVKFELPHEFKEEFKTALARALRDLVIDVEFAIADSILTKSRLTDEQAKQLADKVDKRVAKRLEL